MIWRVARAGGYDGPVTTDWYFGMRFNHHLSGDMSQCTYVDTRYEPNEMFVMAKLIASGMCVVDVGANAGIFTLMSARLVGDGGTVHAFEPSPRDRERLLVNVAINGLANVHVHAEALGREPGKATLEVSGPEHPGHSTIGGFAYPADSRAYSLEVDVTSLDDFARGLTRLDLLKIDEAYDPSLRQLGTSAAELLQLLRDSGYELRVFGPSGSSEPLVGDELTGVNLLCLPRP